MIAISDRPEELERVTAELAARGRVRGFPCDVGDQGAMDALAAEVGAPGGVNVVVANAGIWEEASVDEIDASRLERMLHTNVTGAYVTIRAFLPFLEGADGAAVVATASTNGLVAEPRLAHYNASKGALVMLVRSLAIDLAPRRIRVNAVAPGVIRTPLIAHVLDAQPEGHFGGIPWGRLGAPEEIASCIAFLASDDASYVTGSVLVCDGGQLACNGPPAETEAAG